MLLVGNFAPYELMNCRTVWVYLREATMAIIDSLYHYVNQHARHSFQAPLPHDPHGSQELDQTSEQELDNISRSQTSPSLSLYRDRSQNGSLSMFQGVGYHFWAISISEFKSGADNAVCLSDPTTYRKTPRSTKLETCVGLPSLWWQEYPSDRPHLENIRMIASRERLRREEPSEILREYAHSYADKLC